MQDNSDLIIRDCCEAEAAEFGKPDTICITVDVLREIVQRHFPGTCLHQIQEPAPVPTEIITALWEAIGHHSAQVAETGEMAPGQKLLDAARAVEMAIRPPAIAQAAPAAVAVPDLQDMLRELRVQINKITVQLAPTSDCSGVWMAHDKMSAALAATPAADAQVPQGSYVSTSGELKPDVSVYSSPAAAPVVLPPPDLWRDDEGLRGYAADPGRGPWYTAETVRALLAQAATAAAPQAQADAREAAITWPKARDVGRFDDMSPGDSIRVGLDSDNDVYVSVCGGGGVGSVEFCNPGGGGGGKSSRTRLALLALMVAMEADNADDPRRDWWARSAAIAAAKGE